MRPGGATRKTPHGPRRYRKVLGSSAEVALDGPRVAHLRAIGILARVAQRSPLALVVPQAIELDPCLLEGPRLARGVARRLRVAAQPLPLALELLDACLHLLVAHRW